MNSNFVGTYEPSLQSYQTINLLKIGLRLAHSSEHLFVFDQVFHYLVRVCLLVRRFPLERKRVHWELRTFLDKDVFLSVIPVRKARHVRTHGCQRFALLDDSAIHWLGRLALSAFEGVCRCSLEVHFVGIDDFGFFFQVEGLLVALEDGLRGFVGVVLFIVGEQLGVGVAHEAVSATRVTHTLVTNG